MNESRVILDTNIVSYLMKGGKLAEAYEPHLQDRLLAITFVTVGELYYGAEKKDWGEKKRRTLEMQMRNFVVIPYDVEIARCYGRVVAERQRMGRPISCNDGWIAACTVRHAVPLITHNVRDFENITALQVISENK